MAFSWPQGRELALSLSFDDARASQVTTGLPLLNELGVRATFYATPANVRERADDWRALLAAGHEIGNHTLSHPCSVNFAWSRKRGVEDLTLDDIERDILKCNRQLQEACGAVPETFAYPCGHTHVGKGLDARSYIPVVAKHFVAGRAYWAEWHNVPAICDLANLMGYPFDQIPLERVFAWIDRARRENGWVVLVGHDIFAAERFQGVSVDALRAVCECALDPANGVWLDTVAAVAKHVKRHQNAG